MTPLLTPAAETVLQHQPPAPPSLPPVMRGMPREEALAWLSRLYDNAEAGHVPPSDDELLEAWLPVCSRSGSAETVAAYSRILRKFRAWLSVTYPAASLRQVDPIVADAWVRWMREQVDRQEIAARTFNQAVAALSSFYGWCSDPARSGWSGTPRNPLPRRPYLSVAANPRPLSEPDLARVVAAIESSGSRLARRDMVLVKGSYLIGARVSEMAGLTWENLEQLSEGGQITISRGKGNKSRTIRISQATLDLFLSIKPEDAVETDWVFPSSRRPGKAITRQAIGARVKLWGRAAVGGSIHVWPHKLRATHATHAVRHGVDVFVLSSSLGHAGVGTTISSYVKANPGTSSSLALG
jgi:site-specific recombinase XerD